MLSEMQSLLPKHPDLLQPQTTQDEVLRLLKKGNIDGARQAIRNSERVDGALWREEAKKAMLFLLKKSDVKTSDWIGEDKEFKISDKEKKDIWEKGIDVMLENNEIETLIALFNASEKICNWFFLDTERKKDFFGKVEKNIADVSAQIEKEGDEEIRKEQKGRVLVCVNFLERWRDIPVLK